MIRAVVIELRLRIGFIETATLDTQCQTVQTWPKSFATFLVSLTKPDPDPTGGLLVTSTEIYTLDLEGFRWGMSRKAQLINIHSETF